MFHLTYAFFESHWLIKLAALFFVFGKMTSLLVIALLFANKALALTFLIIYAVFIVLSIALCLTHFFQEKKKARK